MTVGAPGSARLFHSVAMAAAVVALAATLPYLPTLDNYFVRDDFGVVMLLSGKPATSFPGWFVSSWTDRIWGPVPADEIRPFPAVSYQLTALGGAASPVLHHVMNVALHAASGLMVLAIARVLAGLSVPAAAFAAVVFVLLPVHGESVAWITGRVDSMPALFYMASFFAFAMWRRASAGGVSRRGSDAAPQRAVAGGGFWYGLSLLMLFVALFTKQTAITLVGTLVAWDLLMYGRPRAVRPWLRVYLPFGLMTLAYLELRVMLFGQAVRGSALNDEGLRFFGRLLQRHLASTVTGGTTEVAATWVVLAGVSAATWLLLRGRPAVDQRRLLAILLFFGPIWWGIGVAPTAVAGYESPRHVYLAAAGWAIVVGVLLDLAWQRASRVAARRLVGATALVVIAFYVWGLGRVVRDWEEMADVSHQVMQDVRGEALSLPEGSLIIVGAPVRSWEWAMPFPMRPPFTRLDLTRRAFIVTPWLLHCCRGQWFDDTRRMLHEWERRSGAGEVVVLRWDPKTGALARLSDREYPALRSVVSVLPQLNSREALDAAMLKIVNELPRPTGAPRNAQEPGR